MQKKSKPFASFVVSCIILGTLFLWALPEIGHRILLADDYYGLANKHEIYQKNLDCDKTVLEEKKGRFLGIYPYRATMNKGCLWDPKSQSYYASYIQVRARKPYIFSMGKILNRTELIASSYKIILHINFPFENKDFK